MSVPRSSGGRSGPIRSGARCRRRISPFSRLSPTSMGFGSSRPRKKIATGRLGAIHQRWRAVPGRFKDYISQPKTNGYRSIHTTVSGRDGKRVEVQIRTRQMHDVAETGRCRALVLSRWRTLGKPLCRRSGQVDRATVRSILMRKRTTRTFFEAVKLEMYSDQVFCFTHSRVQVVAGLST